MTKLNILKEIESDIIHLLSTSPLMPPTLLVRPFEESLIQSGRVTVIDNVLVKFSSIELDPIFQSEDLISVKWRITWEIMVVLRDLRGHHSAYQLLETILFLLTDYKPIYASRPIAPRVVAFTEYDENKFRYWSITMDHMVEPCHRWYHDQFEPAPLEAICASRNENQQWLGLNADGQYNICWSRYQKPGENFYRYYNSCSQREGDEIDNVWFPDGPGRPGSGGGGNGGTYGPGGPGDVIFDENGNIRLDIDISLWRNTTENLGEKDPKGVIDLGIIRAGADIIKYSSRNCRTCRPL